MILGVDHLALSTETIATDAWTAAGFGLEFSEADLPNGVNKQPVLSVYEPTHDIAYLRSGRGIGIELTRHAARLVRAPSPVQVLFTGAMAGSEPYVLAEQPGLARVFEDGLAIQARPVWWPTACCQCWLGGAGPLSVRAVLLAVPCLERDQHFWRVGLQASLQRDRRDHDPAYVHIAYRRPVAAWSLDALLMQSSGPGIPPLLDQAGFPCIALLSNRLDEDAERACLAGGTLVCPPWSLTVHRRPLRIAILRGPAGELVELIEISRTQ